MALAEANAQYATGVYFRLTQGGVLQHVQPGQLTDLLRRTRLPDPVLATMWQIANPNSLPLDKDGISGVLRLVSCFQNQLDWQTLAPSEPVPLPRIDGLPAEDILPARLLTQISIQGQATNVGVRVEAKPMLSGQGNASRTSLNSEVAMEEADFRLTPAEKFEAESAFQKYSNGTTHVRVGGLEELYLKSGLQRTDWNKICELIDWQKLGQIDQNQMSYLLHLVNERKRGRRLPTSIPSDVILAIYLGANKGSSGSSAGASVRTEMSAKPSQASMSSLSSLTSSSFELSANPADKKEPALPREDAAKSPASLPKTTRETVDSSESDFRSLLRYAQAEKDQLGLHHQALERELKGLQTQVDLYRKELLPAAERGTRLLESLGIR